MNILYLNTNDLKGGAAIACFRLTDAIGNHTNDSPYLIVNKKYSSNENIISVSNGIFQDKMAIARFAFEKFLFLFQEKSKDVRFGFSTAKTGVDISSYPQTHQADVIHLHWINQGFLSLHSLQKLASLNKPIVWTLHDMWPFTGGCHYSMGCEHYLAECGNCPYLKRPDSKDLSYKIHQKKQAIYEQMNLHIVAPSSWLSKLAMKSSLFKNFPVSTIPNPINTERFQPFDKIGLRKKLRLPQSKWILMFAAEKSNQRKGFDYLKDCLEILTTNYPNVSSQIELLIVGEMKKSETENEFPFPCQFTGYISTEEEMANYYAVADLFILPSLLDNLPNTLMEALACGTPCVSFNTGGIPDLIDHKENGYLVKYKSSEDLANGLSWCLEDSNRYNELAKRAREKVVANYSYEIVSQQYSALYRQITSAQ